MAGSDVPDIIEFVQRTGASLAKVLVVPPCPTLRVGSRHLVRGYVTLLGALKHRTPEQMIRDLGLLTLNERLSFGLLNAGTLMKTSLPFGGVSPHDSIQGVNVLRLLHIPGPKQISFRADTRFPGGASFRSGNEWLKDYWLPGSGLPQFEVHVQMFAEVLDFCPAGVRFM